MKKFLIGLFLLPSFVFAQDCGNYFYLTNNGQVQMKVYDKKGKESGTQTWKITDVKKDGKAVVSTVNASFTDEKGKELTKSSGSYRCENGMLKADVRMSMPQEQMQAYKDAEGQVETVYLEYPAKLTTGQSLNDADFTMNLQMKNGVGTTKVSFKEVNRKVGNKESITTPAGTWEAYIITYDATFRTEIGGIGIPFQLSGKEWFVPQLGIVKTETYNKNGKLIGSSVLSSITK
ncbi:MAG TPA: hypothetical protein VFR58_08675 [Flavisolibacter sp.]|nr:hypothetical protein [Flavisolibacter sp.]